MFVSAFAFLAGCKDGTNTREAFPKDSIPYKAFVHKVEPSIPRPPPKADFLQSEYFLDGISKGDLIARILGFPNQNGEKFILTISPWISTKTSSPAVLNFASTFNKAEESTSRTNPDCALDLNSPSNSNTCFFDPFNFAIAISSDVENSSQTSSSNFSQIFDNTIDYLPRINEPTAHNNRAWEIREFMISPYDRNHYPSEQTLKLFPELIHSSARFHTWILLPDRALGPIETRIGSDSTTFLKDLEERNRTAPPRDRLPPEYQKDQRTWVEQSEDLHVIQPGIHLDMVRTKGGTKLALKYRLPWLRQDSVHLDLDPYVLQGMEVPKGIKEIRLVITSPHGNRDFKIAVPAHPLGDGTCAGSFLINPKSMLANFDIRVYSVFAVTNGQLAGPLMAERNGVHWLQPGLPKPKLRTKAWDPAEETEDK
ncbi:MAG: hypothetical protein IPK50_12065 [Fibrobacterota bacterium]|nr:MAG: hypothetical protein IPK50_12065 [Fibrobacterota bacterium]